MVWGKARGLLWGSGFLLRCLRVSLVVVLRTRVRLAGPLVSVLTVLPAVAILAISPGDVRGLET